MRYFSSIVETIGHTPLVRLNKVAQGVRPLLLAKVEYFNPGGSVKDRIGISMIEASERPACSSPAAPSSSRPAATPAPASRSPPRSRAISCIFVMTDKVARRSAAYCVH